MAKHWIQKAIKHPGRLTEAAHRAGESVSSYAASHEHAPGIGAAARLYENVLKPSAHKKKHRRKIARAFEGG